MSSITSTTSPPVICRLVTFYIGQASCYRDRGTYFNEEDQSSSNIQQSVSTVGLADSRPVCSAVHVIGGTESANRDIIYCIRGSLNIGMYVAMIDVKFEFEACSAHV